MSERQIRRVRGRHAEREGERGLRVGAKLAGAAGAGLGAAAVFAPAAAADTFVVSDTSDSDDGACTPGDCSLREAVYAATDEPSSDTITFASGLSGEIALTDGIYAGDYGDVVIQGPGANLITVSGEDANRVFKLFGFDDPNSRFEISGLTLANGFVDSGGAVYSGGFFYSGPGIYLYPADLTITNSVVTDSYAEDNGGGVYNAPTYVVGSGFDAPGGELTIQGSVISDNYAAGYGGGVASTYAGYGPVTIADSQLTGNRAGYVGGVRLYGGLEPATITRSTISGNVATADPPGQYGYVGGVGLYEQEATIDSSTISGNQADGRTGGVQLWRGPDMTIQNSTVSGNVADADGDGAGGGGGVYNENSYESARAIRNSTISGNTAAEGGGVGAGDYDIEISSSIVANNSAPDGPDLFEGDDNVVFELGFSLVESTAGARTITESPAGSNITGLDPQLGPLASNGGPTQTHAPALTSPVLDGGIANGLAGDQRGAARTSDLGLVANRPGSDGTDIGSVEIQAADVEAQCQGSVVRRLGGTAGDDNIVGTDAPETLAGLAGNDALSGVGGNDCLNGDEGRDNLKGGAGKDQVRGGPGKDKLKGQGGKDKLNGGPGKDKLNGGPGKDKLKGGPGKDKLRGGPGKDKIKGNGGNDRINAVDGKRDKVNCGGGNKDKAVVDAKDKVSRNCEKVIVKG